MTKREFLKTTLGSAAALATLPLAGFDPRNRIFKNQQEEEELLSFFYPDDVLWHTTLGGLPKSVIQNLYVNREYVALGRAVRFTVDERRQILDESRRLVTADEQDVDRAHTQFALVAGGVLGELLDRELSGQDYDSIAAGAHYLRVLHAAEGGPEPTAGITAISEEDMAEAFALMRQRNLIRLHTFRPEWEDAEAWIGNFLAMFHELEDSDRRYARAYLQPDADVSNQLAPVYLADDRPVRLARELRLGRIHSAKPYEVATMVMPESAYGRALQAGAQMLEDLGAYVVGRTDVSTLTDLR